MPALKPISAFALRPLARTLCAAALVLAGGRAYAGSAGASSAAFLKMDIGARAAALGGAFVAAEPDVTSLLANPGTIGAMKESQVGFMHDIWIDGTTFDFVGFTQMLSDGKASVGGSLLYLNMGQIEKVTKTGYTTGGDYQAYTAMGTFTYSRRFGEKNIFGATLKRLTEHIEYESASAFGLDLGYMHEFNKWRLGLDVMNLGTGMTFRTVSSPLPRTIRAGAWFNLFKNFSMAAEMVMPDSQMSMRAGMEYASTENAGKQYFIRGGFKSVSPADIGGMANISLGFGLKRPQWQLDYAVVPFGSYGMTHWITLIRRISATGESGLKRSRTRGVRFN